MSIQFKIELVKTSLYWPGGAVSRHLSFIPIAVLLSMKVFVVVVGHLQDEKIVAPVVTGTPSKVSLQTSQVVKVEHFLQFSRHAEQIGVFPSLSKV